ncbi:MAG: hypothetical protein R2824_08345 [Saprospiraceae bacterium]
MNLEELNSLVKVVTKNKVKQLDILEKEGPQISQLQELYQLLSSGEIKCDRDGEEYFFKGNSQQEVYFNRLKRRLKRRLINTLFFIDVNQPSFTNLQKAYYTCYRDATAVKILMGRVARKPAITLAEKIIKKSIKYDFTDITLELARTLRSHFSNIEGNKKKFIFYKDIVKKYSKIYQAELKAEEYYSDIMINFTGSHSTKPELIEIVKTYYDELRKIISELSSYKLNFHAYTLFVLRFEIQNDYKKTIEVCNEAIGYFEAHPHLASKTVITNFSLKKLASFIMLKKFKEGEKIAKVCLSIQKKGSINWLIVLNYYVILSFHSNQYERALDLFKEAKNHFNIDNMLIVASEHWKIYEAFLFYLAEIDKINIDDSIQKSSFRISKFLNEVPIYSKDKQGINIPILIIQILFLLHKGQFDTIIDRTESLKIYVHRYLRRDGTFRSNCFIKMLLCLPAANFHKAGVIRRAKKYVELLNSVPIGEANQSPEVEIIPYEMLWEFVLESLENKFYKI